MVGRLPNPPKSPLDCGPIRRPRPVAAAAVRMPSIPAADIVGIWAFVTLAVSGVLSAAAAPLTASGPNFVVWSDSSERSAAVVEYVEALRTTMHRTLFGQTHPEVWVDRCEIHVHASERSFSGAVGGRPVDARGATTVEFSGDRVSLRRIDVMGDGGGTIPDALAHELVHVVLADHFTHEPPPRWADEGLALLFDPPEKQRRHDADMRRAAAAGMLWEPDELLALEEYPPEGGRLRVFYGQSATVVRWLVGRRDAATFIRFLDDAAGFGWEPALDRHYGLASLDSLSSSWKEVPSINECSLLESVR